MATVEKEAIGNGLRSLLRSPLRSPKAWTAGTRESLQKVRLLIGVAAVGAGCGDAQLDPCWPATLGQLSCVLQMPSPSLSGLFVPAHWQLALSTSLIVHALLSLQLEPC